MALLQLEPTTLRGQAQQAEKLRQTDLETMRQLRVLVMSLRDSWRGEAQDAFVEKFLSMNETFSRFSGMLEEYIQLMEKAANDTEQTDVQLAAALRGV